MNSREIVKRTLGFDYPERVARTFAGSDIVITGAAAKTYATDWHKADQNCWERKDDWGNTWRRIESFSKGEVFKGVIESLEDIDSYVFPDFSDEKSYQPARLAREANQDKWLMGALPGFAFVVARDMLKLEEYLVNLKLEYEAMQRLHDRIDDILETMIVNYGKAGMDSIFFCEDWGTQIQTLISPDLWHQEFYPRFKRLCGTAHDFGMKVFMHSCGAIKAIIPWLIDAGVDVLQFDQPELHGIDTLAAFQENAKITFWCPVDIQKTLQEKNEEIIRAKAREMLARLWKGRGGFIAKVYGESEAIGLEPIWEEYAADEFIKRGVR
jgi:hypothetical protein